MLQVVHNYTIIDYSGGPEDCNQQVLYTTAFRAGVAVNNATAAGIIPNTTAIYILGIGNLSFPIIENPFAPGNLTSEDPVAA